jgi:hypothetical protein
MTQGLLAGPMSVVRDITDHRALPAINDLGIRHTVGASRALTSMLLRHSAHFGDRCDGPVVGQADYQAATGR